MCALMRGMHRDKCNPFEARSTQIVTPTYCKIQETERLRSAHGLLTDKSHEQNLRRFSCKTFVISGPRNGKEMLSWCVCTSLERMRIVQIPTGTITRGGHESRDELVSTLQKCYRHRTPTPNVQDYVYVLVFKFLRSLNQDELFLVPKQQTSVHGTGALRCCVAPKHAIFPGPARGLA